MANIAQATFVGANIVIQCDGRWDCCQREQAAAKVKAMNQRLPGKGVQGRLSNAVKKAKKALCASITGKFQRASNQKKAAYADRAGAPKCLSDKIANGEDPEVQMDHPLDTKLGGPAGPPDITMLTPLETPVNGAFGSFAKNLGKKMKKGTDIESISLVCPADKKCKSSNNAGPKRKFPDSPAAQANVTTYNFSALG